MITDASLEYKKLGTDRTFTNFHSSSTLPLVGQFTLDLNDPNVKSMFVSAANR